MNQKKKVSLQLIQKLIIAAVIVGCVFSPIGEMEAQTIDVIPKHVMIGKEDVVTPTSGATWLTFGKGGNPNYGLWGITSTDNGLGIGRVWNADNVISASLRSIFIKHDGTVGISGWAPDGSNNVKLDVYGQIRSFGNLVISDRRYKKGIEPINGLENLFKVKSVQYKASSETLEEQFELFKLEYANKMPEEQFNVVLKEFEQEIMERDADTTTHFGFVAQELREVYPNLVYEDAQGYLSVNYTELIPVLVEAVKELKMELDELKGVSFWKSSTVVLSDAVLYQNNPNPFTVNTEIKFCIPENAINSAICVYDMVGSQLLKFDITSRGYSSITVHGNKLTAGMYMYSLLVDGKEIDTKRMILTDN